MFLLLLLLSPTAFLDVDGSCWGMWGKEDGKLAIFKYTFLEMSTQEIRERLMDYIAHADEKKLEALPTLLDIDAETTLTQEQIHLLNEERTLYFTQKEKSFTAAASIQMIRGEK